MNTKFKRYLFICTNERPPEHPRGSCGTRGSIEILEEFKKILREEKLNLEIRANKCGCMEICESGPNILISPDNIWYKEVKLSDVREIVESHIKNDIPVERLIL